MFYFVIIDFSDLKTLYLMYYIKNWPKNKEMERFTSDGGHLGYHLEYFKFLNDASWASSRF